MKDKTMSDEEWAKFFELMEKVTMMGKPFHAKLADVVEQAENQGQSTVLAEFVTWFGGEVEDEEPEDDGE